MTPPLVGVAKRGLLKAGLKGDWCLLPPIASM